MTQLSPKGFRAVEVVANRTGFTEDAVTSMLFLSDSWSRRHGAV